MNSVADLYQFVVGYVFPRFLPPSFAKKKDDPLPLELLDFLAAGDGRAVRKRTPYLIISDEVSDSLQVSEKGESHEPPQQQLDVAFRTGMKLDGAANKSSNSVTDEGGDRMPNDFPRCAGTAKPKVFIRSRL
eukprot:c20241_g1_i1 orf=576-971(-)